MTDILQKIVAHKQVEIALQQEAVSIEQLIGICDFTVPNISMKTSLAVSSSGIIAEFKRRSPSKGWIKENADVSIIPSSYEQAGATALSILTDEYFFGGSLKDIQKTRPLVNLPILRKDFIINEYQLYQAKAMKANTILLIAACLTLNECKILTKKAHELDMEVLLEIHTEKELDYIDEDIDLVGINNRNLGTFHTNVENSFRIIEKLPKDILKVSESGISNPQIVKELRHVGFQGFLIGENFMKKEDPGQALQTFIHELIQL